MGDDGSTASGRPLRRDAAENAERLLAAAIRSGLNEGKNVPLAAVAAEAGVGVGTLYRRYPNREALLEALQIRAYRSLIGVAEDALETASTGIEATKRFLTGSFDRREELVLPLHGAPWLAEGETARLREQLRGLISSIAARGHADGTIRGDVTAWTIVQFGALLAQPLAMTPEWERGAAQQREVFLRGIACSAD